MHIDRTMLHPELRTIGSLLRTLNPAFTARKFRFCNRFLDTFYKGRAFTRRVLYRQAYALRPDGTRLRLCVYLPKTPVSGVPGVLWIHGGGYALGVPEQDVRFAEDLIEASPCAVVMPDYTRSTEAPYPAALDDCYRALLWLKTHAETYRVREDQLFVGGDSAGGGLAAAVCLLARDRGDVSVAFQMPLYPMLDDRMETPSACDNDAPAWNSRSNEAGWRMYLGSRFGTEKVSKYAAPARETEYHGLPPMLTFVGSVEPFRDETVRYVEAMQAAGGSVTFRLFDGCFHAFDTLAPHTAVGREARRFLCDGFARAAKECRKAQPESASPGESEPPVL